MKGVPAVNSQGTRRSLRSRCVNIYRPSDTVIIPTVSEEASLDEQTMPSITLRVN
ncbi:MAG: hypothetical protein HC827_07575 [Cyanobacteria bacterium RM1_2_2]|nr:hypothetical protein [Cyanobacteria bacterium RM1_2_2]